MAVHLPLMLLAFVHGGVSHSRFIPSFYHLDSWTSQASEWSPVEVLTCSLWLWPSMYKGVSKKGKRGEEVSVASSEAPRVASSSWEEELKEKPCSPPAALLMSGISAGITDNDSRDN